MSQKKKNTGLFFGSFNPVHTGHVMIANYMVEFGGMDEVWFIVSPQNPFKTKDELLPQEHRLKMTQIAVKDFENISVSDIEFAMTQPSYTINTLNSLSENYPDREFHILMGTDNVINVHRWKNADTILKNYPLLVYPRNGYPANPDKMPTGVTITHAPIIDISSTMIREWLTAGHDVRAFMPAGVYDYIKTHNLL